MEHLESRKNIARMVDLFYQEVRSNKDIGVFFNGIKNWEIHQERMTDFWCFVLLDQEGYTGSPIEKHFGLGIQEKHFKIWLELFYKILDSNFEGELVEKAKKRAEGIASMLNYKLSRINGKSIS